MIVATLRREIAPKWSNSRGAISRLDPSRFALQGTRLMTAMRPAKTTDDQQGPATEFEGEIREIIRRDVAPVRKAAPEASGDAAIGNLNNVIQRVSASSAAEIDKLIAELQILRDFLHNEGQRVQREIAGYAHLSQTAMHSTRVITDSLSQWQGAVDVKRTIENGGQ
jgi:hypothetical protein